MAITNDRDSSQRKHSLRFAVMCNGKIFPEWQARCIKALLTLPNVHLVLLILDDDTASSGFLAKLGKLRAGEFLFQLYRRLIARPACLRLVDMTASLSAIPLIRCKVIRRGKYSQYFTEQDIRKIEGFNLDFILRFGFNIIRGEILNVARYGVWSFHHDDEMKYRGSPPCFWEIYTGDRVTGAVLQKLTDRLDGGVILRKGYFPTIGYSYASNLNRVFLESLIWPAQVSTDILNGNTAYLDDSPSQTVAVIYRTPTNFQMVLFWGKLLKNFFIKMKDHFFCHEEWNIGIIKKPICEFIESRSCSFIQWLPKPAKGQYLADPFAVIKDQKIYVLCEDFDYGQFKAVISYIELTNSGSIVKKEVGIREPFHMSYPYLFEYQDAFYCVPETAQACEVSLYKAECFPSRWVKVSTLIKNFPGVDSTVFKYEGRWWLACTNAKDGKDYKLFIWYAPELFGPWEPHVLNPVKIDVRSARPAGTPYVHNGSLYRPAQDCSATYGGRIILNRVIQLSPTVFEEEATGSIEPDGRGLYRGGLHTLSAAGDITVIDGKRHVFLVSGFSHACLYLWRKSVGNQ